MASKINADEFVNREGEDKPTLPKGVVLSGVTTITTAVVAGNEVANSAGINAGIITSTHFAGNLTGDVNAGIVTVSSQTVIGSAVTISASGIDIGAGVITATSYAGNGANLTGLGATIMVWEYNPDPSDMGVPFASGIGITFNQKIKAGSGNITLRKDSSSGTVVENFGIGSSVTISNNELTISPTSNLEEAQVYHISYPSGVITNMAGESYVGTAYTFKALAYDYKLFGWGSNEHGDLGQNNRTAETSPKQIVGTTWSKIRSGGFSRSAVLATKNDGTLWSWGYNVDGQTGQNGANPAMHSVSSPTQLPGSWSDNFCGGKRSVAVKANGTLWCWGSGPYGGVGNNNRTSYSSPVLIGSATTWSTTHGKCAAGEISAFAIKTDGTLWGWGQNDGGAIGVSPTGHRSSPTQIPGTTWSEVDVNYTATFAIKTDGTLWSWGSNQWGALGQNNPHNTNYSSPKQIPGTTWRRVRSLTYGCGAVKTDGTLWTWGRANWGTIYNHQSPNVHRSSPVQVPGTTWNNIFAGGYMHFIATKTDGTIWAWGNAGNGGLGQGNTTQYSSPVQIPGTTWNYAASGKGNASYAIQQIEP